MPIAKRVKKRSDSTGPEYFESLADQFQEASSKYGDALLECDGGTISQDLIRTAEACIRIAKSASAMKQGFEALATRASDGDFEPGPCRVLRTQQPGKRSVAWRDFAKKMYRRWKGFPDPEGKPNKDEPSEAWAKSVLAAAPTPEGGIKITIERSVSSETKPGQRRK